MSTPPFTPDPSESEPGPDGTNSLPPLLRRPDPIPDPVPLAQLRGVRKALLDNPRCSLDEPAANAITAGAVDPLRLRALVEVNGKGEQVINLLTAKPIIGGTLFVTGTHARYLDLDVLPDFINQRWAHLLRTPMDVTPPTNPVPTYETLQAGTDDAKRPLAVLTVKMRDRKALAYAVTESMRQTHQAQGGENDYTDSVLQQGVKEPLTLIVVRVVYDDGSTDTYLVAGDGNSRIVSMWLARTGGDIDAAAAACVASLIGPTDRVGERRPADQRAARRRVEEMAARVRRGLAEPEPTEATRREGHTLAFPAVVVVGAQDEHGNPLRDLVSARDDLLANLHVRVTPWAEGAQNTQGMQRVYRHALGDGLISQDIYDVVSGRVGPQTMHELLGLPPHRLWSAGVHQYAVLAGLRAAKMNRLIRQEFGMGKADRQRVSERLAPMALSAYRSSEGIEQSLRAFGNGGTITDRVWKTSWALTPGDNPLHVLDDVLERALAGHLDAIAELTVLGGTAAIIDGYITRDRGSKEGVVRDSRSAPFRATPTKLLTILSSTAGGLCMLHSIARAHVAADPTTLPKQFHTRQRDLEGVLVHDGEPVRDQAGVQKTIDYEWDLVYAADPVEAEATIAKNRATANADGQGGGQDRPAEDVLQRRALDQGITGVLKAAQALAVLSTTRGREVFGSPAAVETLSERLRRIERILTQYGPVSTALLASGDEDEDEETSDEHNAQGGEE
ncbi:hypothetical protein AB0C33_15345 [Nonomuraea sp. NPDC048881]|uniref:hypothetical protein n=1 Tax=Nonomuraea sp. NPDC048881 TaxID=3155030 RepID=UPI0033C59A47